MPAILVIGPSHAGKSTLVTATALKIQAVGLPLRVTPMNLDEELGSSNRSDGARATQIVASHAALGSIALVDCGAGQLAFSSEFRRYVTSNLDAVIAVWCDLQTFRTRHSPDAVDAEIRNNYAPELREIWEAVRGRGRLVNTSGEVSPNESTERMAAIILEMVTQRAWI